MCSVSSLFENIFSQLETHWDIKIISTKSTIRECLTNGMNRYYIIVRIGDGMKIMGSEMTPKMKMTWNFIEMWCEPFALETTECGRINGWFDDDGNRR